MHRTPQNQFQSPHPHHPFFIHACLQDVEIADDVDWELIASQLDGYSGDDIMNICRDAAMNGMRKACAGKSVDEIRNIQKSQLQIPVCLADFMQSVSKISPSVSKEDLQHYEKWKAEFGSL